AASRFPPASERKQTAARAAGRPRSAERAPPEPREPRSGSVEGAGSRLMFSRGRNGWPQVLHEPAARRLPNAFEGSRLLEQMCRPGDDLELHLTRHVLHRVAVHLDDRLIEPTDDEQRGCDHPRQRGAGEIATSNRYSVVRSSIASSRGVEAVSPA